MSSLRRPHGPVAEIVQCGEPLTTGLFPGHKRLVRALYDAPTLLTFPNRDRPGKKEGTCELVMSPLPYILVYTVRDASYVVRALHGAQQ